MSVNRFFFAVLILLGWACQNGNLEVHRFSGTGLGTNYTIKFFSDRDFPVQRGVDSIFEAINRSLSNYKANSDIAKLNAGDTSIVLDRDFRRVFLRSKAVYKATDGYFDPTVGVLVNAYGFGPKKRHAVIDSTVIDSLMQFVGFDRVRLTAEDKIVREDPRVYLDFGAIGKGYAVDRVGMYLEEHGIENYLVEIGGEFRAGGKNLKRHRPWHLGISDPRVGKFNQIAATVNLKDKSMATSGNYRNFREDTLTGQRFVHIINPKSGFMQKHDLRSATVTADDCATADAYATAFMAMGLKKAKKISQRSENKGIEVFFMFDDHGKLGTYLSPGFRKIADSTERR